MKNTLCCAKHRTAVTMAIILAFLLLFTYGPGGNAATVATDGSFEGEDAGTDAGNTQDFAMDWIGEKGIDTATAVVMEGNGGKYLHIESFYEFYSYDLFDKGYTFSVDAKTENGALTGFFVRSGRNPAEKFPFYEWDWYAEKEGKNGTSGIGGSGISIHLMTDGVRVNIKNYQDDGSHVSNTFYDFTGIEGYRNPAENFNTITVADEGTHIVISINGKLLASIELSDVGTYEVDKENPPVDFVYCKTAIMKNAAGEELVKMNNARVLAEDYMAAIGVRGGKLDIDNITISYEEDSPDPTEEPKVTPSADPTEETPSKTKDPTEKPSATSKVVEPQTTNAPSEKDSFDFEWVVWVAIAAVVVGGIAVAVTVVIRKKKNDGKK